MKISASIYATKANEFNKFIDLLDKYTVDYFHIDSQDELAVFEDIKKIRTISNKPIDLHVITDTPDRYIPLINEHQPEFITFQYEPLKELDLTKINYSCKKGLAIVTDTEIDSISDIIENFDFILFMATSPGKSGGSFDKINFRRIRDFKQQFPNIAIHVDGGVNAEVSFILRNLGIHCAVSGSYLFKEEELGIALLNLKLNEIQSSFRLKDFMRNIDETPTIHIDEANLTTILESIERNNLGFTVVIDNDNILKGMVTNADVRKGLLKNKSNFNNTKLEDILNTNPVAANENYTVVELLKLIKSKSFPISYLPIIDDNRKIKGSITFFNLIKGEL
jgi:pentose-5-phosphate-3-epimerase/CBS domain-containing protein